MTSNPNHPNDHTRPLITTFDLVIVGAGVIGAATARAAARRGCSVLLLEGGSFPDVRGSSRGATRIWHFAGYPTDDYLQRNILALAGWRDLERESGASLLLGTGGGLSSGVGVEHQAELLGIAGRGFDLLTRHEVERRWPGVTWWGDGPVLHQVDSGVILARSALRELLASAEREGAALRDRTAVRRLEPDGDEILVVTDADAIRARRAVVTAGPWARSLLATAEIELDVVVTEQTVAWYPWPGPAPPIVIDYDDPGPYALFEPGRGLKAALHNPGRQIADSDEPNGVPEHRAVEWITEWVSQRFSQVGSAPTMAETCRYTWTPDERFRLERRGPVVIGSACSGRGFQYAPNTAERLVDLAFPP